MAALGQLLGSDVHQIEISWLRKFPALGAFGKVSRQSWQNHGALQVCTASTGVILELLLHPSGICLQHLHGLSREKPKDLIILFRSNHIQSISSNDTDTRYLTASNPN